MQQHRQKKRLFIVLIAMLLFSNLSGLNSATSCFCSFINQAAFQTSALATDTVSGFARESTWQLLKINLFLSRVVSFYVGVLNDEILGIIYV